MRSANSVPSNPTLNQNSRWQLLEIVQTNTEGSAGKNITPLQLFRFAGKQAEEGSALWFVAGNEGAARGDGFVSCLFQKALTKGLFTPAPDIYLTPLVNPSAPEKVVRNANGVPVRQTLNGFPTSKLAQDGSGSVPAEVATLSRWAERIKPKALVSFSSGASMIRYLNTPEDVVQKLSEISERPAYPFGLEPEQQTEDGNTIPRENIDSCLGMWCVEQGILWIDFSMNSNLKTFEEVAQTEWRSCVGPALKWLVEGLRFNPPKEEPAFPKLQVIPALEMPPEFANL